MRKRRSLRRRAQDAQDAPPSAPSKAASGLPSGFHSTWKHWENTVTQESNAHDDDEEDDDDDDDDDDDSDSDSSMEASRETDEHRSPGRANTKKNPSSHGLGHRDHEARPHGILVPSATTLTSDTAASAPPFHPTSQREYTSTKGSGKQKQITGLHCAMTLVASKRSATTVLLYCLLHSSVQYLASLVVARKSAIAVLLRCLQLALKIVEHLLEFAHVASRWSLAEFLFGTPRVRGFDDEAQDGLSLGVHGTLPLDPVLLKCFF